MIGRRPTGRLLHVQGTTLPRPARRLSERLSGASHLSPRRGAHSTRRHLPTPSAGCPRGARPDSEEPSGGEGGKVYVQYNEWVYYSYVDVTCHRASSARQPPSLSWSPYLPPQRKRAARRPLSAPSRRPLSVLSGSVATVRLTAESESVCGSGPR